MTNGLGMSIQSYPDKPMAATSERGSSVIGGLNDTDFHLSNLVDSISKLQDKVAEISTITPSNPNAPDGGVKDAQSSLGARINEINNRLSEQIYRLNKAVEAIDL